VAENWISVVGGVSAQTRKPFLVFEWGEKKGQLDVEEARAHALLILEACSNAVSDAALFDWASDRGMPTEEAAGLIGVVRQHRADRWGQPDLGMEFADPPPDD
jgi:hypothetical protein